MIRVSFSLHVRWWFYFPMKPTNIVIIAIYKKHTHTKYSTKHVYHFKTCNGSGDSNDDKEADFYYFFFNFKYFIVPDNTITLQRWGTG